MLNASAIAAELDDLGRIASQIGDRLVALRFDASEFENMVIASTELDSKFRASVTRAGTGLAVCTGKTRVLSDELERSAALYRGTAKL